MVIITDVQLLLIEPDEPEKEVFATLRSLSGSEVSAARLNSIKAACMFEVWTAEYDGQREVKHDNRRMTIYRTFNRPDGKTELYTEERAGRI